MADPENTPPEPTNVQRAQWARNALAVFTAETYGGDHPDTMHPDDLETAIGDLICDLLHLARYHPRMDAAAIHSHARDMFEQELCDCAARKQESLSARELLEGLDMIVRSLSPRKIIPVLKAAGYATDIWKAAHKNASALLKKFNP